MRRKFVLAAVLLTPVFGQTRVDVGAQGKNIDFSNAPLVRPFRTGSALPATCVAGEMFFKTLATAGSNVFGCSTANTWVQEGSGSGIALNVVRTDGATLTIGPDCTVPAPCNARIGATTYSFSAPATISISSGAGLAYVYLTSSGAIMAGIPSIGAMALNCTGCFTANQITQFPLDSIPLAAWNATAGTWDSSGTDERAILAGGRTFTAGENIILTESGNNVRISATVANADGSNPDPGPSNTAGSSYDPLDMTVIDRAYIFVEAGYNGGAPWWYSGGCGGGTGTAGVPGEMTGLGWSTTNNACVVVYPGATGGFDPIPDFISASVRVPATLKGRYARGDGSGIGAGDHYIGWSSAKDGTIPNFVGIRFLNSANAWQCVIRAAGVDVTTALIPATPDNQMHTFTVSSGTTVNSVTCKIDAGSVSVTGAIPSASWFGIMGTSAPSGVSYFTTVEARIHISGIAR